MQNESLGSLFYEALAVGLETALGRTHVHAIASPPPVSLGWACTGAQVSHANFAFQLRDLEV